MRHGCTVALAAAVIAELALTPTAGTAEPAKTAAAPLQLNRFMAPGPTRRSSSRPHRRAAHRPSADKATADTTMAKDAIKRMHEEHRRVAVSESPASGKTLTAKTIPTVSVSAPALALAPATEDRTAGFTASTQPWSGEGELAPADDLSNWPLGVTIARAGEVNEIDLAADAAAKPSEYTQSVNAAGISLITPANAAPSQEAKSTKPRSSSWLSWLYGKIVDGILAAALAIRSLFA